MRRGLKCHDHSRLGLSRWPIRRFPDEEGTEICENESVTGRSACRSEDSPMRRGLKCFCDCLIYDLLDPIRRFPDEEGTEIG